MRFRLSTSHGSTHDESSFKNATVFPDGNMDECDHDKDKSSDKMKPSMDAFKRCAIREAFEETGILITSPRVVFKSGERKRWRKDVHNLGQAFAELLSLYKTSVRLDELTHYAKLDNTRAITAQIQHLLFPKCCRFCGNITREARSLGNTTDQPLHAWRSDKRAQERRNCIVHTATVYAARSCIVQVIYKTT